MIWNCHGLLQVVNYVTHYAATVKFGEYQQMWKNCLVIGNSTISYSRRRKRRRVANHSLIPACAFGFPLYISCIIFCYSCSPALGIPREYVITMSSSCVHGYPSIVDISLDKSQCIVLATHAAIGTLNATDPECPARNVKRRGWNVPRRGPSDGWRACPFVAKCEDYRSRKPQLQQQTSIGHRRARGLI